MHINRSSRKPNNFKGGPGECCRHTEEEKDGKDNFGGGVNTCKLPKTKDSQLGIADERLLYLLVPISQSFSWKMPYQSEKNALQNRQPPISEFLKLVSFNPSGFGCHFAEAFECGYRQDDKDDKNDEEHQ